MQSLEDQSIIQDHEHIGRLMRYQKNFIAAINNN
jgi:hypothetical protein